MSSDILGDEFDIHGGGVDLIFPHHENEIAQSEGAGKAFARYWIHNGLLTIKNEKMAKSLGNFISIKDFMLKYKDADYLKLLFLNTHYRHPVDYTEERIQEMKAQKERFVIMLDKADRIKGHHAGGRIKELEDFKTKFEEAMDDDFNMPLALGVLFKMIRECNRILDDKKDDRRFMLQHAMEMITKLADIFGLSFKNIKEDKSDAWVIAAVALREQYRKEKKYKEADDVRKALEEKGIILEDTKDGPIWRRKL